MKTALLEGELIESKRSFTVLCSSALEGITAYTTPSAFENVNFSSQSSTAKTSFAEINLRSKYLTIDFSSL